MRKIIFVFSLFLILFFDSNVYAICDSADIARLKGIAENIQITYEHNVYGSVEDDETSLVSVYDIIVSGLTDDVYVIDDDGNTYYTENNNNEIYINTSSGKRYVYLYSKICRGVLLDTRVLNLPYFNFNSMSEDCQKDEFRDLDVCAEFVNEGTEKIERDEFEKIIEEEKDKRSNIFYKIKKIVIENVWYVVFFGLIIVAISIILFIRHRKRSVLE